MTTSTPISAQMLTPTPTDSKEKEMTMSLYNPNRDPRFGQQPQQPRRGQNTLKRVAVIAAMVAVVAAVLAAISTLLVPNPCGSLERRTASAYSEYTANNARLKALESAGSITSEQRFRMDNASFQKKNWQATMAERDRCSGAWRDKRTTVMTVPAAVSGLALMVAFYATVALMLRSRRAAKAARVTADATVRAAQAARTAHEARQQRRAHRAHAAQAQQAATATAGAGYGTGYNDDPNVIDAEVVDFPYADDEYAAPQPEAPREEPSVSKPASGWGSAFTFEEE